MFSRVISCCLAVQDLIQATKESALAETTLKDKLHFVKTVYSSSSLDLMKGQKSQWLSESCCHFLHFGTAGRTIAEEKNLYHDGTEK